MDEQNKPQPSPSRESAADGPARSDPSGVSCEHTGDGSPELRQKVVDVLKTCYDPEIPVDIYQLGLIYAVDLDEHGNARVRMTLTSPMCPVAGSLPPEVENKIASIEGVRDVRVDLVWDPPWTPEKMSEAARLKLNLV